MELQQKMERVKLSTQQESEVVGAGLARNLNNQPITTVQNPPVQETPFPLELAHELLAIYGSPLYVYQGDRLRQTIGHITQAIPYPRTHFHFASVTNGNVALLQIFQASGWGLHANTPGDIYLGLQAGFDPSQIVYSGSNLNRAEMEQVLNWGVTTLNLDSLAQLRLCCEVYQFLQASVKAPRLGLRLNLPELTGDSRIGVRPEEFPEAIALTQQAGLKLSGLHFYRGTGTNATKAFTQVIDTVLATAKLLPDWEYLDFGGGFGYPYHHDGAAFDWEMFGVELTQRLSRLGRDINLVIEPGRAAIAGCATLLAQVVSLKWQDSKQILGVDTTVANLSVPSVHGGYREIVTWVGAQGDAPLHPTDVCGNTTYSRDYLGRNCQLAALEIGDIIAILDVGAYGYAMSSHFLHRPRPAEVLLDADKHRLIRKREDYSILLENQVFN
jgi:diaminopimelate decarboxylase